MEINQILPQIAHGDAISNHVIELRKLFRSMGFQSEIYVLKIEESVLAHCRPFSEFRAKEDTITLYHYSIGNDHITQQFRKAQGKKVLIYHNITPHHFFEGYSEELVRILKKGRESLGDLSDVVDLAVGDSEYNAEELRATGYKNTTVLPILLNFEGFQRTSPRPHHQKYVGDLWTTFLFTGRVVPNKAHHDIIRVFAWYNQTIDPLSRLILVGGAPFGGYLHHLYQLICSLNLADRVFIPGKIKFSELIGYYQAADIFLCMSDHEGFCVPLLEAMHFGIPIIAYDSTGVTHTLGNAGVLVKKKDPRAISEVADLIVRNPTFRDQIVARQKERLKDFEVEAIRGQYEKMIRELLQ